MANDDFNWDEVLVTNKPDSKEVEVSFKRTDGEGFIGGGGNDDGGGGTPPGTTEDPDGCRNRVNLYSADVFTFQSSMPHWVWLQFDRVPNEYMEVDLVFTDGDMTYPDYRTQSETVKIQPGSWENDGTGFFGKKIGLLTGDLSAKIDEGTDSGLYYAQITAVRGFGEATCFDSNQVTINFGPVPSENEPEANPDGGDVPPQEPPPNCEINPCPGREAYSDAQQTLDNALPVEFRQTMYREQAYGTLRQQYARFPETPMVQIPGNPSLIGGEFDHQITQTELTAWRNNNPYGNTDLYTRYPHYMYNAWGQLLPGLMLTQSGTTPERTVQQQIWQPPSSLVSLQNQNIAVREWYSDVANLGYQGDYSGDECAHFAIAPIKTYYGIGRWGGQYLSTDEVFSTEYDRLPWGPYVNMGRGVNNPYRTRGEGMYSNNAAKATIMFYWDGKNITERSIRLATHVVKNYVLRTSGTGGFIEVGLATNQLSMIFNATGGVGVARIAATNTGGTAGAGGGGGTAEIAMKQGWNVVEVGCQGRYDLFSDGSSAYIGSTASFTCGYNGVYMSTEPNEVLDFLWNHGSYDYWAEDDGSNPKNGRLVKAINGTIAFQGDWDDPYITTHENLDESYGAIHYLHIVDIAPWDGTLGDISVFPSKKIFTGSQQIIRPDYCERIPT